MTRHDYDPTSLDRRPPLAPIIAGCIGFIVFVLAIGCLAFIAGGVL